MTNKEPQGADLILTTPLVLKVYERDISTTPKCVLVYHKPWIIQDILISVAILNRVEHVSLVI